MSSSQLLDCVAVKNKVLPERGAQSGGLTSKRESFATSVTNIALSARLKSLLLGLRTPTVGAFFSSLFTSLNNYALNPAPLLHNLTTSDPLFKY